MALEPKDVVIHLTQGMDGAYFQFRHQPTGVETEPMPRELFHLHREELRAELEQKVANKLAGKLGLELKPEDIVTHVERTGDGNHVRVQHTPTKISVGNYPLTEFSRRRKQIMLLLNALVVDQTVEIQERYFEPSTYIQLRTSFWTTPYLEHLWAMSEDSLWQASINPHLHAYRFLWLRTFHAPIVVRLNVDSDGKLLLTSKITSGLGGYRPGEVIYRDEIEIDQMQMELFLRLLESINFWQMPLEETDGAVGLDGAQWVLEAVTGGKYKMVNRWSPEPEDPFRMAALSLVEMAGLEVEQVY